jgi:hypothetical protein
MASIQEIVARLESERWFDNRAQLWAAVAKELRITPEAVKARARREGVRAKTPKGTGHRFGANGNRPASNPGRSLPGADQRAEGRPGTADGGSAWPVTAGHETEAAPRGIAPPAGAERGTCSPEDSTDPDVAEKRRRGVEQLRGMVKDLAPRQLGTLEKCLEGNRKAAITLTCVECSHGDLPSVRDCTCYACPLWHLRPFQRKPGPGRCRPAHWAAPGGGGPLRPRLARREQARPRGTRVGPAPEGVCPLPSDGPTAAPRRWTHALGCDARPCSPAPTVGRRLLAVAASYLATGPAKALYQTERLRSPRREGRPPAYSLRRVACHRLPVESMGLAPKHEGHVLMPRLQRHGSAWAL